MRMFVYKLIGHYYIVLEMHVCDLDINHKLLVNSKMLFIVGDEIGHFICEDYSMSTKIVSLNHGN